MKPKDDNEDNEDNRKISKMCSLKKINVDNIVLDKLMKKLESELFKPTVSTFGGIIDIRPKIDITRNIFYKSINRHNYGNTEFATMYPESDLCPNENYTLCCGLYGAAKIVKKLLHMIKSPVQIRAFNINIMKDGKSYILRDLRLPGNGQNDHFQTLNFKDSLKKIKSDRIILAVSTRRNNSYGHYTLAIIEKGELYSFDPVGICDMGTIEVFERQNIKYMGSIYDLNPKCYKTLGHQDMKTHYCSIWSACLALTLGLNPDKSLINVFDYFGVKAFSPNYLETKIKSFATYLNEFKYLIS